MVNFFNRTKIEKGKIGAIYTLHLIGINRQIVGRFLEKFTNQKARSALLELLKEKKYANSIVSLLMRDPWQSDIPYFFKILKNETDDEIAWPIVDCLTRYKISELPITPPLPNQIANLSIQLKVKNENVLESNFDFDAQIKNALGEFVNRYPGLIEVDKKLYYEKLSKYYKTKMHGDLNITSLINYLGIEAKDVFSYARIGCKIQYYVQDEKLYFCTIKTAQERLNNWWRNLPSEEKEKFK